MSRERIIMPYSELMQDPLTGFQIAASFFSLLVFLIVTVAYFGGPPDPPTGVSGYEEWA